MTCESFDFEIPSSRVVGEPSPVDCYGVCSFFLKIERKLIGAS